MYSESDLNKNDYNKLLFINRELQQIVTNLTNDLEKLLDKSIKKEVEYLKINNYSLVLNYDGKKFLYKGFIPSSKTISLNLQQYDMSKTSSGLLKILKISPVINIISG